MIVKLLFLIFMYISLNAHQTGLSYINIKEDSSHTIEVIYKKPLADNKGEDIIINYPAKCSVKSQDKEQIHNGFIIQKYVLWCSVSGLSGSRIWIEGLRSKDRGVLIRYEKNTMVSKSLLRATSPFMSINNKSGNIALFFEYVQLGIAHILSGYDHLLFVLALILLSTKLRSLLLSVTGFTIAHSITLGFGVLGVVNIGVAYIEAMIALSILFLARELVGEKNTFTKQHLGVVAFIFGLLHGFGFSSVLRSIGLPQEDIALSLFAFNVGIEFGQIIFILIVSSFLLVLRKYMLTYEAKLHKYIAYIIGTLSAYWVIERVLNF